MAELIRYVDPSVAASGSGTTWTAAYISLSAWEAAEQTALNTAGNWMHVYCRSSAGTADTIACNIDGWGTSAASYISIEATSGHEALKTGWNASRYALTQSAAGTPALTINDPYVRIDSLQIYHSDTGTSGSNAIFLANGAIGDVYLSNCRLRGGRYTVKTGTATPSGITSIWNTILYGSGTGGVALVSEHAINMHNSIIYDGGTIGMYVSGGPTAVVVKNCAVFKNGNDFSIDGANITIDYCATDDGDGTNAVSIVGGSAGTGEFINPAGDNFTLLSTGNCYQGGADNPSSGLYTTDIEGDSYNSGAYSVGVDEYIAAATGAVPVVIMHQARMRT